MLKLKIAHLFVILAILGGLLFVGAKPVRAIDIDEEEEDVEIESLEVTKTNNPVGEVAPGTEILYTIVVKNVSEEDTGEVVVRDHWRFKGDETATYIQDSASDDPEIFEEDQRIIWRLDNLEPGEEAIFTYKLQADPTNEHLGTFTIINRVCAEVTLGDPCAKVRNTVTYTPAPTPSVSPVSGSSRGGSKIVPTVLGTTAPTPAPEVLPLTGAQSNFNWVYLTIIPGLLLGAFLLKRISSISV